MPQAPISYRRRPFIDRFVTLLIIGLLFLTGLSVPSNVSADDPCDLLHHVGHPPSDAAVVMDTEVAYLNGLELCLQAYESTLPPREVMAHYRTVWSDHSGVLHEPEPGPDHRSLQLNSLERSVKVTAFASGAGSAVQLSLIPMPGEAVQPEIAPEIEMRDLKALQDLRHDGTRTLTFHAESPPPVAMARVTEWLTRQGYRPSDPPPRFPSIPGSMKTRLFEGRSDRPRLYLAVGPADGGSQAHILFLPSQ